ncbi:MAG TPA: DUF4975 domain-containing protein [Erysipelotrichaceae bacterium]|nr:DUF4975 domain-containing protein [Erysipelotrichaceae bacterium]
MRKVYYRSPGKSVCADVIPFFENGEFKLFYLRDYRDIENEGEGCPWCLLTTKDLVNYVDYGPVLLRGAKDEQDLYVFTGSIIKNGDEYVIFYTGHNPHLRRQGFPEQKILRATSKDLINWKKDKGFVFEAPDHLEMHDFRDPFVYFDKDKKQYSMLITARDKNSNPTNTKALTHIAHSTDLINWKLAEKPFYYPHSYFAHECPDFFKMGDWYYLLFSEFTEKISTTYRMSKTPYGPWISPMVNTFDGHAFYAAKSYADDKGRRIIFGWNPIKNHEVDFDWWQWGGNIIPHEIKQKENGELVVSCPKEIREAFVDDVKLETSSKLGKVKHSDNKYIIGEDGLSYQMFKMIPNTCKIEAKFTAHDLKGSFGFVLRSVDNGDRYYKVKFELKHNRLAMDSWPRKDVHLHSQLDTERYVNILPGKENKILIIMQESVLEVYVNDEVAMSARMFDIKDGEFGIYSLNTATTFTDIEVKK